MKNLLGEPRGGISMRDDSDSMLGHGRHTQARPAQPLRRYRVGKPLQAQDGEEGTGGVVLWDWIRCYEQNARCMWAIGEGRCSDDCERCRKADDMARTRSLDTWGDQ